MSRETAYLVESSSCATHPASPIIFSEEQAARRSAWVREVSRAQHSCMCAASSNGSVRGKKQVRSISRCLVKLSSSGRSCSMLVCVVGE